MKWLINDIRNALQQLRRVETWMVIGILALFIGLSYLVAESAFRTDSILQFLRHSSASCRELTNGPIIFLFCGMIFFLLAAVVTLGEIQSFQKNRRLNARLASRAALIHAVFWGSIAILIPSAAIYFFKYYC